MEFKLNEDQQMIHDLAKDFAESVLQPRIDEIEAGEMTEVSNGEKHPQLPHDIHQQLAECGFIGISFPEEYNGLGMGHVEQAIVIKELSRISPSVGKGLDVYILGLEALDLYASPEQKEKYLAPQIEVIQMETEGTSCVIAGSGNLGGFGNGGSIGTSSRSYGRSRGSRNASSSELEDLINDILTIEK